MRINLLAIDLDGTLLNSAKQISATTAAILRTAREVHGVHIVLSTARPPRSVMPFYELLNLDTPMINYNGAMVYDPPTQAILMHRPIQLETARRLITTSRNFYPEVIVSVEVLDQWFTDRITNVYMNETAQESLPDVVAPIDQWLTTDITKLLLLGLPDRLAALKDVLSMEFMHQISMSYMEKHMIQVMHATVSKVQALRMVASDLGVRREQVMAIGDNVNDVEMLKWAGVGVAMANAAPKAIDAADIVTDYNDSDGVAKIIHEIILKGLDKKKRKK